MNSIVIKCVAGSGKTSYALQYLKNNKNGIYLAYNNKMVNEVTEKGYIAKTIDSFFINYIFPKLIMKIPAFNSKNVEISYLDIDKLEEYQKGAGEIGVDVDGNIVYQGKCTRYSLANKFEDLSNISGKYGYHIKLIFTKRKIYVSDKLRENLLGYVLHNFSQEVLQIVRDRFDYLIVDEAQDLKDYKEALIKLLFENGIRLIISGDEHQNINGGGNWFSLIEPNRQIINSYRCPEKICEWIRETLNIEIYGNKNDAQVYKIKHNEVSKLDNGNRVLLYKSKAGKYKEIIDNWMGYKQTIQSSKGLTIDKDIVIVGKTINKNFYYTSLTRTTKNVYTTIEQINN